MIQEFCPEYFSLFIIGTAGKRKDYPNAKVRINKQLRKLKAILRNLGFRNEKSVNWRMKRKTPNINILNFPCSYFAAKPLRIYIITYYIEILIYNVTQGNGRSSNDRSFFLKDVLHLDFPFFSSKYSLHFRVSLVFIYLNISFLFVLFYCVLCLFIYNNFPFSVVSKDELSFIKNHFDFENITLTFILVTSNQNIDTRQVSFF